MLHNIDVGGCQRRELLHRRGRHVRRTARLPAGEDRGGWRHPRPTWKSCTCASRARLRSSRWTCVRRSRRTTSRTNRLREVCRALRARCGRDHASKRGPWRRRRPACASGCASSPDGEWRAREFIDKATVADNGVWAGSLHADEGGRQADLRRSRGATPRSVTSTSPTAGLRAGLMFPIIQILGWDLPWASSAMLKCIEIKTTPGTITDAQPPACVSAATATRHVLRHEHGAAVREPDARIDARKWWRREMSALDTASWTLLVLHGLQPRRLAVRGLAHGSHGRRGRRAFPGRTGSTPVGSSIRRAPACRTWRSPSCSTRALPLAEVRRRTAAGPWHIPRVAPVVRSPSSRHQDRPDQLPDGCARL